MTLFFALRAWLQLLLLHHVGATAAPPYSLGNTIEADLIFPHQDGRYAESNNGVPVVIGIQNTAAAARFGFKLRWQLLEAQDRRGEVSVMVGGGGPLAYPGMSPNPSARLFEQNANSTITKPDWGTTATTTKHLSPGNYTLQWAFGVAPYCEFGKGEGEGTARYELLRWLTKGELRFVVVGAGEAAPPPPRSLLSSSAKGSHGDRVHDGGERSDGCPRLMGVINYASTASWDRPAQTQTWPGGPGEPAWSRVLQATTVACAVTAPPTFTPGPCRATVDPGVESSVFDRMGWPLRPPPSSSSRSRNKTTGAATMTHAGTRNSTATASRSSTATRSSAATKSSVGTIHSTSSSSFLTTTSPTTTSSPTAPKEPTMLTPTMAMSATERKDVNNNVPASPTAPAADPASFPGFINAGVLLPSPSGPCLMLTYAALALLSLSL